MRLDLDMLNESGSGPTSGQLVFRHCLRVVLACIFMTTGLSKLLSVFDIHLLAFQTYGWPTWGLCTVGLVEVLGAICILIPNTTLFASSIFSLVLFGATFTHIFSLELLRALLTGALFSSTTWLTLNDQGSIAIELELDKNFSPEAFEKVEDSKLNQEKSA